ncbi:glycosyltransferase family 1 protein [Roseateles sp. DAIF2]|uniref:glycosyltransferase family 4 protein n=1 Tax=Roseateles sp. DAIF2 TaxID=2714952 RepID=UPI0018A30F41|nr:glycosyltransferase family 1 protein [Roseateles sp. DAIF2]QPF75562.1 glycosyltransferase family 1 protein [Roseateles sp. DAIF2]
MKPPAAPPEIEVDEAPPLRRSLRIALVTETYPPEVNGVARTVACVVEGLRARNHAVQLLRPRQQRGEKGEGNPHGTAADERFHEVLMRGLPIPRYPHLRMGVASKRSLVQLWTLRRPDIVHIATEGPLGWSALQAASYLKLPICSDFRTNFHAYSKHYGIGWLNKPIMVYLRKFHNKTQCTMVPDAALRDELQGLGFAGVRVLARGVDTQLFDPARRSAALRESWGAAAQDPVVLHVGRLAPEKNLVTLVEAFESLRQAQPRARLVLVGDGPARAELQARLPDAVFAGMRHGEELASFYASGDLFVFPSLTETYGNVTAEALASGLPVLAYDYAAAGQLVDNGVNGWRAPFGNAPEFLRLARLLGGDFGGLRAMGAAARARAEQLSWAGIVGNLEGIYAGLIDAQGFSARPHIAAQPA